MERHVQLVRTVPLARGAGLARTVPLRQQAPERTGEVIILRGGGKVLEFPKARVKDKIPAAVRRLVTKRDMGLCVYTGRPADHIHHRRLRGMGGSADGHVHCPCNLVSLTFDAHEFVHRNRVAAVAGGLIVPGATRLPGLLPVLVRGPGDECGRRMWPSCDGEWLAYEPDGDGAA